MNEQSSKFKIVFSLFLIFTFLNIYPSSIDAQSVADLQQKIADQTLAIKKLEKEISQYQGDLVTLASKKSTLKNAIAVLDITRKKLETDIKITQTKVDTTDLTIRQLNSEILYKENEIIARVASLKEALLSIYERDEDSLAQVALSNESFSGLWNDLDMLEQFSAGVNENVEFIKSLKFDLEQKNKKKEKEKGTLLDLRSTLNSQKKVTEDTKKQQTQLLIQTSSQESKYQKTLKEKLALRDALEKELSDYESTLKFILDPSSIPPRGTKVFISPVDNPYITQNFGKSNATNSSGQRLYVSGTHNGTDFRATMGSPVKAMLSGVVVGTGNTDLTCPGASFGKWVLIDHQNGLASISAHLSLVNVSAGDMITTGERIGFSGNTGYSTGPHLHISVYARKAVTIETRASKACSGRSYTMPIAALNGYLDPMDYIKI